MDFSKKWNLQALISNSFKSSNFEKLHNQHRYYVLQFHQSMSHGLSVSKKTISLHYNFFSEIWGLRQMEYKESDRQWFRSSDQFSYMYWQRPQNSEKVYSALMKSGFFTFIQHSIEFSIGVSKISEIFA